MNIKTLLIRSASGLVYITLIIGAILLGGIYFKIIFGLLAILTVYEFHTLTNKQENINALPILGAICAAVAFAVVSYYKQPSWLYIGVFFDNLCRYRDVPKDPEPDKQCSLHYFRTYIYSITVQPYGIYSLVQQKTTTRRLRHNLDKRHFRISYRFVDWQT